MACYYLTVPRAFSSCRHNLRLLTAKLSGQRVRDPVNKDALGLGDFTPHPLSPNTSHLTVPITVHRAEFWNP